MINKRYYISTGSKRGFYTLRVEFDEPTYYKSEFGTIDTGMTGKDHYVMSLTRDQQSSFQKARNWLAENDHRGVATLESASFDLNEIGRSGDWTKFHAGKHEG